MKIEKLTAVLILTLISLLTLSSCSDKENSIDDTVIGLKDLPAEARSFLSKYYAGISVKEINKDIDGGMTIYEVKLENGHEVIFNDKGEWDQVEAPSGESIPTGFILEEILKYLNQYYNGYGINEINKTGDGYKVELVTELDLMFNKLGQFTGIMNDD